MATPAATPDAARAYRPRVLDARSHQRPRAGRTWRRWCCRQALDAGDRAWRACALKLVEAEIERAQGDRRGPRRSSRRVHHTRRGAIDVRPGARRKRSTRGKGPVDARPRAVQRPLQPVDQSSAASRPAGRGRRVTGASSSATAPPAFFGPDIAEVRRYLGGPAVAGCHSYAIRRGLSVGRAILATAAERDSHQVRSRSEAFQRHGICDADRIARSS